MSRDALSDFGACSPHLSLPWSRLCQKLRDRQPRPRGDTLFLENTDTDRGAAVAPLRPSSPTAQWVFCRFKGPALRTLHPAVLTLSLGLSFCLGFQLPPTYQVNPGTEGG